MQNRNGPPRGPTIRACAAAALLSSALISCDAGPDRTADTAPRDSVRPAVPEATGPAFDPGNVFVGDTVAGLEVIRREANRAFGDSAWVGSFTFRGRLVLSGVYLRHFDYPEPALVCFHVLGESVERVPRFEPDAFTSPGMKTWFCFTNQDRALELLGDAAVPREATIVIDSLTVVRHFTDAFATASLTDVVRIGDAARNTLRDPPAHPQNSAESLTP
jgi:hypothetical protein